MQKTTKALIREAHGLIAGVPDPATFVSNAPNLQPNFRALRTETAKAAARVHARRKRTRQRRLALTVMLVGLFSYATVVVILAIL